VGIVLSAGLTMLRRPVAAALVVLGAALTPVTMPAVTGASPACAAATGPHAALVIETGTRDLRLCVALDAPDVTGIHLIELAGAQQNLSYGFGSGGQAVCRLAGVGPQGDDCFADYPDFWGYWRGDGHGGWTWSSTGAASSAVLDGDLNGWVWGRGDTGTTHARPPSLTVGDVCVVSSPSAAPAASPSTRPKPSGTASASRTSTPSTAPRTTDPSPKPRERSHTTTAPTSSDASVVVAAAAEGPPAAGGGPGPGLLLALVFGAALAGGGWLRLRSGRRHGEAPP
jgi:hypothetical protein